MLYEGQFLVLYVIRDQLLMLASYHAGFTQGIPHPICATKPAESVLRRWMREAAVAPITAFPGNGQQRAELAEIAALKKEVAKLKAERDILKKAAAFLAREAT
mgnify:CR=1 FL=1